MTRARRDLVLLLASALLGLVGTVYVGRGCQLILASNDSTGAERNNTGIDLRARWREQRYLYRGKNPYDVAEVTIRDGLNTFDYGQVIKELKETQPETLPRDGSIEPDIGPMHTNGYPPWSLFTAAGIVLPTDWKTTRLYFTSINLLSLAVIAVWAYRVGRPHGVAGGLLLAAAATALLSNYTICRIGQYGIIINALLIGALALAERARGIPSGVLLGMALLKPQISWLFGLAFLVRKQWGVVLAATVYVILASSATWAACRTDPLEMLGQMLRQSGGGAPGISDSPLQLLVIAGVKPRLATVVMGLGGALLALLLMFRWRHSSPLALFAIASVLGRLVTYHHRYDNVMLVFLLVALGKAVLEQPSKWTIGAFVLVGLTLWLPGPAGGTGLVESDGLTITYFVAQTVIWLAGLAVVLAREPRLPSRLEQAQRFNAEATPACVAQ